MSDMSSYIRLKRAAREKELVMAEEVEIIKSDCILQQHATVGGAVSTAFDQTGNYVLGPNCEMEDVGVEWGMDCET